MPDDHEGLTRLIERDGVDPRIVAAFRATDRALFVPPGTGAGAYADRPIRIPRGQTTSQPSLIAHMIEACETTPDSRVLEVGAGFGFQTALLARLAREVIAVELHADLADAARRNLAQAGIANAQVVVGDGWRGWPEGAPYEAIVVAAAAEEVPDAFEEQLVAGGRLVIPVKTERSDDVLVYRKTEAGLDRDRLLTPARFVPLVRGAG